MRFKNIVNIEENGIDIPCLNYTLIDVGSWIVEQQRIDFSVLIHYIWIWGGGGKW